MISSRQSSITVTLFILLVFFVLAFHVYSPHNYYTQYFFQETSLDSELVSNATTNLILFFLHIQELDNELFTEKEMIHFEDVRNLYNLFFIIALSSAFLLYRLHPKLNELEKSLSRMRYYVLLFLIVLPIFGFFWNIIFHTILFRNNYWIVYPHEISYHLFPIEFFMFTFISIVIILEIVIFLLLYVIRKKIKT